MLAICFSGKDNTYAVGTSIPMVNITLCPFESRGRNVRILFLSDSIFFFLVTCQNHNFVQEVFTRTRNALIWRDAIAYVLLVLTFRNGAHLIN